VLSEKKCTHNCDGKTVLNTNHHVDPNVDGRLVLRLNLHILHGVKWTGINWLPPEVSCEHEN
jgi:hypothetical protein